MLSDFIQSVQALDVDIFPFPQPEGAEILTIKKQGVDIECTVKVGVSIWLLIIKNCKTYTVVNEEFFQVDFYENHPITSLWEDDQFELSFHGPKERGHETSSKLINALSNHFGCIDSYLFEKLGIYSLDRMVSLINGGFGILLSAPNAILDVASTVLKESGFECGRSYLCKADKMTKYKLLKIRNSWFIGEHFSAESNNKKQPDC